MVNHHNIKMMINNLIVCLPPQRIQVPRPPRVEPVRLLGRQGWSVAEVPVGSTVPGNIFNFQLLQIMHGVRRCFKGWVAAELAWTILLMQAHHLLKGGLQLSGTPAYRRTISIQLSHIFFGKQSINFLKFCANADIVKNCKNFRWLSPLFNVEPGVGQIHQDVVSG